ncbi:MAG: hypothetical protein ABIN01_14040 [Ferruginibacter sp.]
MQLVLVMLFLGVIIFLAAKLDKQGTSLLGGAIPVSNVLSHWSHSFRTFSLSSDVFYKELEEALKQYEMPHSVIHRTKHKEGGMLSAAREYLRIKHGDIVFDVCAAPFGKGFFISWWLYETAGTMRTALKNTRVGNFLQNRAQNRTFYQVDEEDMFRSCVHECILETITKVSEGKALMHLSEADKAFKMGGL